MDNIISKVDNKKIDSMNGEMSAEENKAKYYGCNDKNCTFEMAENYKEKVDSLFKNGEIVITSVLDCGERQYLQGVKINLYKINGLSPVLIKSKITDEDGIVVFSEVEEGCYRIIEIVDKRYFEKPKYINWNEIIIDNINKNQEVIIINRIKRFASTSKHKNGI